MKTVGIIGRAYRNYTKQEIFQVNDFVRRAIAPYKNIVPVLILPTGDYIYCDLKKNGDELTQVDKTRLNHILNQCDGFISPGGSNWFNFDAYIIHHAIKEDKPLFAICAGFQCLCSLYAVRPKAKLTFVPGDTHHNGSREYSHTNYITQGTRLHQIIKQDEILVNSVHHYYVNFKFDNLIINARSIDGLIEGVELPNKKFIVGVQWHPEYFTDEPSTRLFDEFVKNL